MRFDLATFVDRVLAGEEGVLLSVKNEVVGHRIYVGIGAKQGANFDEGPFPLFSVVDWLGHQAYHWYFAEFYQTQLPAQFSLAQLEALPLDLNIEDLTLHAQETPSGFAAKIKTLQQQQQAGEFWVANLTQNLCGALPKSLKPRALALKVFYEFLKLGQNHCGGVVITKEQIFCSTSPETFLLQAQNLLKSYPIKGTGSQSFLAHSSKEIAELSMITDLIRNDLGQICDQVWVERERYLTAEQGFYHARAEVCGTLKTSSLPQGLSWHNYKKLLPAGSISGAPKQRVLQTLQKLENFERGFYTGTFGLKTSPEKSIFNILIRTLFIDEAQHTWSFPVGAGITIDSDPLKEWEETLQKAEGLRNLLQDCA